MTYEITADDMGEFAILAQVTYIRSPGHRFCYWLCSLRIFILCDPCIDTLLHKGDDVRQIGKNEQVIGVELRGEV